MITLIPEEIGFKISTTDLLVEYRERKGVKIQLEVFLLEDFEKNFSRKLYINSNTI